MRPPSFSEFYYRLSAYVVFLMTAARWLLRAFTVVVSNRGVPSGTDDRRLLKFTMCMYEDPWVFVNVSIVSHDIHVTVAAPACLF